MFEIANSEENPNPFIENDIVMCTREVNFVDGTKYEKGQTYIVTKETLSYFNICYFPYRLYHRG